MLVAGLLIVPAPASADLPGLLSNCAARKDALDNDTGNGTTLPFTFCDDGVPAAAGGTTPNPRRRARCEVPAPTTGIAGLPATNAGARRVPGEDPAGNSRARRRRVAARPGRYPGRPAATRSW